MREKLQHPDSLLFFLLAATIFTSSLFRRCRGDVELRFLFSSIRHRWATPPMVLLISRFRNTRRRQSLCPSERFARVRRHVSESTIFFWPYLLSPTNRCAILSTDFVLELAVGVPFEKKKRRKEHLSAPAHTSPQRRARGYLFSRFVVFLRSYYSFSAFFFPPCLQAKEKP